MLTTVDACAAFSYTANRAYSPEIHTVIFIHGASHDHTVWSLQSRYFAYHGWHALAIDLPGHGRSAGAPLAGIEASADWLMRFLDAARIEHAALVGHSMGSLIALEAAARYPARVSNIALVGSAAPMAVGEVLLNAARANDHAAFDMVTIWGHQSRAGGNSNPGMWMLGANLRLNERAAPDVLYTDLNACNAYRVGLERAKNVQCAALLISGKRDLMTPPKAVQALAAALPDAKLVLLDGGHALMAERPDAVLDELKRFLDR